MSNTSRLRRARKWMILALAALIVGVLGTQPNFASTAQDNYVVHTLQCVDWLLHDFPMHQANCVGTNVIPPDRTPVNSSGSGNGSECEVSFAGSTGGGCDPCSDNPLVNAGGAGNAGNAGNSGDGCNTAYLAPLAAGLINGLRSMMTG